MTWNLFIDDERTPEQVTWGNEAFYQRYPWVVVRNIEDMKREVYARGFPEFISFDHDLGSREPSGKDCADWLINYDLDTQNMPNNFAWFVHSKNPIGRENINKVLESYSLHK